MTRKRSIFAILALFSLDNILCETLQANESLANNEITNDENQTPQVEIDSGKLIGTFFKTAGGRKVYAFLGVPYAAPPINELRFKEPQPVNAWNGTRTAVDKTYNSCLQFNHYTFTRNGYGIYGDEDCLYLNVYTPKLGSTNLLDVIVFIHGGAFMFADGKSYTPKFLLDRTDLVFVSINYRLGPFGFLSTGDNVIPGNNGLKDQTFALKWVQKNIKHFGGDCNKVTLAGMSAGGASVHYHYLSKLSRNLFDKGISISGTATNPWAFMENGRNKSIELAKRFDCDISNSISILECLQKVPGRGILEKVKPLFMPWLYNPFTPFGPTVEAPNTQEPFLSESPYDLIKKGDVKRSPWLLSVTADEGLYPGAQYIINNSILDDLNSNWYRIGPHLLDFNFTVSPDKHNITTKTIHKHYFKNKTINESSKNLIDLLSDRLFLNDIGKTIKLQASWSNNIYLYKFLFRGKYSVSDYLTNSLIDVGISHGDDLPYILGCYFKDIYNRQPEKELVDVMVTMWLSFIKSGRPELNVGNFVWSPIKPVNVTNNIDYIVIKSSKDFVVISDDNFGDTLFWNSLPIQE